MSSVNCKLCVFLRILRIVCILFGPFFPDVVAGSLGGGLTFTRRRRRADALPGALSTSVHNYQLVTCAVHCCRRRCRQAKRLTQASYTSGSSQ